MRIQLEQIRDRPLHWQETIELLPETIGESKITAPAAGDVNGQIAVVEDGFLLTLAVAAELTLRCDHCLDEFQSSVESELESLVLVEPEPETTGEVELDERELGVLRLDEPELDTEPLVVGQVQLAVPMSARCRDDCAGLCPQCGVNRNHEKCDCRPPVDPRWQALTEI